MKTLLLFVLLTMPIMVKNDKPLELRAKSIAEEYYSSLQQLAQCPNPYDEEGARIEDKILKLAGQVSGSEGIANVSGELRISNDIDPIFGSVNSSKSDLTFSNYIGHYKDYVAKYRDFIFLYKVISCEQLEAPSLKGVESDEFAKVVVRKTLSYSNKFCDVDETMILWFTKNKATMSSISNSYGTLQTPGDLFAQALEYYNKHQYEEALDAFEDFIRIFNDIKAKYYASLMYLKKQGCKDIKRSERNERAVRYLRDAKKGGIQNAEYILVRLGVE